MLRRKNYIAHDGERFTLLIGKDNIPDFWTTLFLTSIARTQSSATVRKYVDYLIHINLFEKKIQQRISERICSVINDCELRNQILNLQMFFSTSEIQLLVNHCGKKTEYARKEISAKKKPNSNDNQLTILSPVVRTNSDITISPKEQKKRIKLFLIYFEFLAYTILSKNPSFHSYKKIITDTTNYIGDQTHHIRSSSNNFFNPAMKAPSSDVFEIVMNLVKPDNENNPYTYSVRQRNYLILRILYETGMRSGELLQLKIEDVSRENIDSNSYTITIKRRHDDKYDKFRAIEPNAKTLERDLPISKELGISLNKYILKERSQIPNAKKHPFLFVSHKGKSIGKPLSVIQLCKLVDKLNSNEFLLKTLDEKGLKLEKPITRHGFRHNFNNRLSKIIDTNNKLAREEGRIEDLISEKKEIEQRMYLNGHKSYKSAEVYNQRHVKEEAENLMKLNNQKISEQLRGNNE